MHDRAIPLLGLGYVGIEAPDPAGWRDFAQQICGVMPAQIPPGPRPHGAVAPTPELQGMAKDGSAFLKLDDRQWRIAVHPGDTPGLRYLGFEISTTTGVEQALASLRAAKIDARVGSEEECGARGVAALAVLHDPAGHRIELFSGPLRDGGFLSPYGVQFVTGALGMGHAVLYVPELDPALDFYRGPLGFRRTDFMTFGPDQGIHFLRCTPRHHSLALLRVGPLTGLQHLMLETRTLDDVGRALDRALAADIPITSHLGRHRNDRTVSFYMQGPSGFDVEIGWDGVLVDESWVENEFAGSGDEWGHHGLDADALKPRD
jgi:2,3-dihydroxybiphenyl 1,2-dioxygenase